MQRLSHISVLVTLLAASAIGQCNTVTTNSPGNNGQNGTMFNIVNLSAQAVKITGFQQAFFSGASDNMFIYTVAGGWSGNENNAAAWTLVGSALAVPHGLTPQLDPLPIQLSVVIGAGATQGFYITGDVAATVAYTTGVNQLNSVIGSDGTIEVRGGVGKSYPFASTFGLPAAGRLWIGRVQYEKTVATLTASGNAQSGTTFDIVNTSGNTVVVWHFDQAFFNGAASNMEIYTRPGSGIGFETNAAAWTLVGSAAAVPHGLAPQLDPVPIPVNLPIAPGATRAFLITTTDATVVAYTSGVNQVNTVIGSDGTLEVRAGFGVAYPFLGAFGQPNDGRLWNGRVHYGTCTIADNTTLGQGCVREVASVYEFFNPSSGFDLNGSGMSFVPAGTAYAVLPGLTAFIPPTGAAVNVAVGDDVQQTLPIASAFSYPGGSTNALTVCSNGFVSVASGNGTSFTPNVANMLNFPQTAWGNWHDFFPTGGANGNVKFEEVGTRSIFTWDAVVDFGSVNLNTWQIQFDRASGTVTIVWVSMSALGNPHLVFHSPGGPNLNPGNTDLSVVLPGGGLTLGAVDRLPLALVAGTRPLIGSNWNLQVQDIPPTGALGVEVFGLSDPGINDLFFLGMPTCGLRASLDVLNAFLVGGPTHGYTLPIPGNPALVGVHIYSTSAVFQVPPINAFGAITSNGIDGLIGNF